jgi:hypothetical protein
MGSEASLWKTLKRKMKDEWIPQRIENIGGPGVPDLYYTLKNNRGYGWIELKHIHNWPKKSGTILRINHYTSYQKNWLKIHGMHGASTWLFLQVAKEYMLFNWQEVIYVGTMTQDQLKYLCKGYWKDHIDTEEFISYLMK